jgi:predicted RNA-binding Zn-ribbon protein involved in translation (DUF1610 family)
LIKIPSTRYLCGSYNCGICGEKNLDRTIDCWEQSYMCDKCGIEYCLGKCGKRGYCIKCYSEVYTECPICKNIVRRDLID